MLFNQPIAYLAEYRPNEDKLIPVSAMPLKGLEGSSGAVSGHSAVIIYDGSNPEKAPIVAYIAQGMQEDYSMQRAKSIIGPKRKETAAQIIEPINSGWNLLGYTLPGDGVVGLNVLLNEAGDYMKAFVLAHEDGHLTGDSHAMREYMTDQIAHWKLSNEGIEKFLKNYESAGNTYVVTPKGQTISFGQDNKSGLYLPTSELETKVASYAGENEAKPKEESGADIYLVKPEAAEENKKSTVYSSPQKQNLAKESAAITPVAITPATSPKASSIADYVSGKREKEEMLYNPLRLDLSSATQYNGPLILSSAPMPKYAEASGGCGGCGMKYAA
ncbi:hypothetical protein ACFL0W_03540 [Nanoarchaeota archaeon]